MLIQVYGFCRNVWCSTVWRLIFSYDFLLPVKLAGASQVDWTFVTSRKSVRIPDLLITGANRNSLTRLVIAQPFGILCGSTPLQVPELLFPGPFLPSLGVVASCGCEVNPFHSTWVKHPENNRQDLSRKSYSLPSRNGVFIIVQNESKCLALRWRCIATFCIGPTMSSNRRSGLVLILGE